ncbi:Zinc finger protein 813-like [Plakobranchus ocellatus]|uniref:Zinc finger protein 813-like n=1 Tax=Plakobranchus ocellatus TaxID=259542 RepID=A0AAV4AY33_9GAST|nr:Zinc finger protein 813-like [Plakobranchus ocellatus]
MEDFVDVVYKCKFCPYTCTQSPEMGVHVKENHLTTVSSAGLQLQLAPGICNTDTPCSTVNHELCVSNSSSSTVAGPLPAQRSSETLGHGDQEARSCLSSIQPNEDLSFSVPSQAFMDKSLTAVSFTPFAVPVSSVEAVNLSNTSTPDLTELINLVKPGTQGASQFSKAHMDSGISSNATSIDTVLETASGQFTISLVEDQSVSACCTTESVPLESSEAPLPEVPGLQLQTSGASSVFSAGLLPVEEACSSSQPYTVMAIQVPNSGSQGSSPIHYVVSTPKPEPINIPDSTETKEFLLCGLCKLAFTNMEDCQAHMSLEHRELMQDTGVSIGVQVGGAKRGRKRKSEQMKKVKQEPLTSDLDDVEWLPSASESYSHCEGEGRARRKIKPPRALKEDYVLGKRVRQRDRGSCSDLGYKLSCPMMGCKAKLKTNEGLRIHMDCHNMEDTALTCKECHAPHEFWRNLRIHLWKKHQIDCDLFACDKCDYKTDTRHKMSIHMEIHSESKPYTCDVCGKGFRQASQMKNHLVTHVNRDSKDIGQCWFTQKKCDVCDRVFANSKCLKKHKEVVHGNHKPFKCTFCSHTTARKAMMQSHMRTHTGEKPFKCDICEYSTGDHNSLRRHKMRHTGQKQYQCTQCPYTCIQSISLKHHMQHKHPGTTAGIFQCSRCPFRSINQTIYYAHMQDHKKGLIPDKLVHPRVELPRVRKSSARSQGNAAGKDLPVVLPLLMKHPQLHAVVPGEGLSSLSNSSDGQTKDSSQGNTEMFNMQVTVLASGDIQISAEDMTRLSEHRGLAHSGTSALQLIYDTLAILGSHSVAREGHSTLLTTQLPSGVHTSVLSSLQGGHTIHSITYHLSVGESSETAQDEQGKEKEGEAASKKSLPSAATSPSNKDNPVAEVESTSKLAEMANLTKTDGETRGDKEGTVMAAEIFVSDTNLPDDSSKKVVEGGESERSVEPSIGNNEDSGSYIVKPIKGDALQEILEAGEDKVTLINSDTGEVNFISVDLLQSQQKRLGF